MKKDYVGIGVIIIVSFFVYLYVRDYYKLKEIDSDGVYIYCTTVEKQYISNRVDVLVKYDFRGVEYQKSFNYKKSVKVPDYRYFMKISVKNPKKCIVFFDKPVPDSIRNYPMEGWSEIPN